MRRGVSLLALAIVVVAGCGSAASSAALAGRLSGSAAATTAPSRTPTAQGSAAGAPQAGVGTSAAGVAATAATRYDHIFLVVFENKSYGQIVGSSAAPNINSLIRRGALATAYSAITHPSLPNYLALTGGSTFGISTDCPPATCPVRATNLGSLLAAHGVTWRGYMETMPSRCGTTSSGTYAVKHDPFVYFNNIRTTSLCRNVVPYTALGADLRSTATTPRFAFVTPNLCHDMHDCSIATGDAWLGRFVNALTASPAWTRQRSLLIVTFDESAGGTSNRVATFAVGSPVRRTVRAGTRSGVRYSHYNLLRTIEFYLSVPTLGRNDANRAVMTGLVPS